jgi:hypothetical protein
MLNDAVKVLSKVRTYLRGFTCYRKENVVFLLLGISKFKKMTITISNIIMFIKGFIIRVMKYIHTQPERQTAYTDPEIGLYIALDNLTMKYVLHDLILLSSVRHQQNRPFLSTQLRSNTRLPNSSRIFIRVRCVRPLEVESFVYPMTSRVLFFLLIGIVDRLMLIGQPRTTTVTSK